MEEDLKRTEDFFRRNYNVKKSMTALVPVSSDAYSIEYTMKYAGKLFSGLKNMNLDFIKLADDLQLTDIEKKEINTKFSSYLKKLYLCAFDFKKLTKFYQTYISEMDKKLVDEVGTKLIGYSNNKSVLELIKKSTSINDMLHVLHYFMMNNEKKHQSLPILEQKSNDLGYKITLYGQESSMPRVLYETIPPELDVGYTDIVSLHKGKKILMMVRDRGHALSIEVDVLDDKAWVSYFIPKICNVNMINSLRGITPVNANSEYAIGTFVTEIDKLPLELIDFVSKVPMDKDMEFDVQLKNFR